MNFEMLEVKYRKVLEPSVSIFQKRRTLSLAQTLKSKKFYEWAVCGACLFFLRSMWCLALVKIYQWRVTLVLYCPHGTWFFSQITCPNPQSSMLTLVPPTAYRQQHRTPYLPPRAPRSLLCARREPLPAPSAGARHGDDDDAENAVRSVRRFGGVGVLRAEFGVEWWRWM